jgi:hypothetical protein
MERFLALILSFISFSILSLTLTSASIYICDENGMEKTSFYSNDTVYVVSDVNITNESKTVNLYVASHRTWSFGTNLTQASLLNKSITTNSSGHVPVSLLWASPLNVGKYDLVADMNGNSTYDSEDLLYNADGNGFSVLEEPVPILTVSKGENSPPDHDWYENESSPNKMLQAILEAGGYEGINVDFLYIIASGTGDDKAGVHYVVVCLDSNKDGDCGYGEEIVGMNQFNRDDGILSIETRNKLTISPNSSIALVFFYKMRNASGSHEGKTYSFQLAMIDAFGVNTGKKARVDGLPISSAVKTVFSQAVETTSSSTSSSTTSTTSTSTTTTIPKEEEDRTNFFIGLAVATFVAIVLIGLFYFFFLRPPPQVYHYKP